MIRRESVETSTRRTIDCAIQTSEETSNTDKETSKQMEVYDFNSPFLFSDMVVLVEDTTLHCHRAILSLYSPVFKAMFDSNFEETSTNRVSLPHDDASTVRELLRHLYTPGGCEMDNAAAQRLLPLIHRFQIDSLITTAERTMTFSMTDSMAPKMLALADLYQLSHLKQAAIDACIRLDMKHMTEALEETSLSAELKAIVFGKRVEHLEKAISDIERSFAHSCIRMESKLERVYTNHCQLHNKPLSRTTIPIRLQLNSPAGLTHSLGTEDALRLIDPTVGQPDDHEEEPPSRPPLQDINLAPLAPVETTTVSTRLLRSPLTATSDVDVSVHEEPEPAPPERAPVTPAVSTAVVEVPTVCENCVEKFSAHIQELCRRALHKAHFVPYKPPATSRVSGVP